MTEFKGKCPIALITIIWSTRTFHVLNLYCLNKLLHDHGQCHRDFEKISGNYCKNTAFYDFEIVRLIFCVPIVPPVLTFAHQLYNSSEIDEIDKTCILFLPSKIVYNTHQ